MTPDGRRGGGGAAMSNVSRALGSQLDMAGGVQGAGGTGAQGAGVQGAGAAAALRGAGAVQGAGADGWLAAPTSLGGWLWRWDERDVRWARLWCMLQVIRR